MMSGSTQKKVIGEKLMISDSAREKLEKLSVKNSDDFGYPTVDNGGWDERPPFHYELCGQCGTWQSPWIRW
jgi:hypothetical protein